MAAPGLWRKVSRGLKGGRKRKAAGKRAGKSAAKHRKHKKLPRRHARLRRRTAALERGKKAAGAARMHEGVQGVLETDVDRLVSLVESRGKVRYSDIVKEFRVNKQKVEEWGQILEGHGLVVVHYPAFGEPVMLSREYGRPKKGKARGERNEGKADRQL